MFNLNCDHVIICEISYEIVFDSTRDFLYKNRMQNHEVIFVDFTMDTTTDS